MDFFIKTQVAPTIERFWGTRSFQYIHIYIYMCVYACVCVCVCKTGKKSDLINIKLDIEKTKQGKLDIRELPTMWLSIGWTKVPLRGHVSLRLSEVIVFEESIKFGRLYVPYRVRVHMCERSRV